MKVTEQQIQARVARSESRAKFPAPCIYQPSTRSAQLRFAHALIQLVKLHVVSPRHVDYGGMSVAY
jgi:hypothetical protein